MAPLTHHSQAIFRRVAEDLIMGRPYKADCEDPRILAALTREGILETDPDYPARARLTRYGAAFYVCHTAHGFKQDLCPLCRRAFEIISRA